MVGRPAPSQSEVERAFAEMLMNAGLQPGPIQANTQGFVRFDAPGDKKGKGNGFYKLKLGEYPVGWYGDWKDGGLQSWFYHDPASGELTAAERSAIRREQAKLKAEAAQAREAKQAEVAQDASAMWKRADSNVQHHPYLERKGISVPRQLRLYTAKDGAQLLAVPMYAFDLNGDPRLTNLQLIDGDGTKRFLKAGRVDGCFFSLKGDASDGEASPIVLCEGVATAFSIWLATGLSVVAAFNAGNLLPVAREFKRQRPKALFLIAGDDDVIAPADWEDRTGRPWKNEGALKAHASAEAIAALSCLPVFADGPDRGRTDYNDLHLRDGEEAVRAQIFGALRRTEVEPEQEGASIREPERVQDETWRSRLPVTSAGMIDGRSVAGIRLFVRNHRLMRNRLAYNELTRAPEIDGNGLEDFHFVEFRQIMHSERFLARKADVADEMIADARRNAFDPLRNYLDNLKWDRRDRLDRWLTAYLGVQDTAYSRAVGRAVLVGSVARALRAGCKLDTMVIVEGPQGTGKSTAIRYLYGDEYFTDNLPDFHSKDSFQQLQGSWCIEVAELNKMSSADVGDVKQFLSRVEDKYRPPYERMPIKAKRRTVFWGTVNPEEGQGYLKDQTGNRRFYPVSSTRIDLNAILRERDQIWAEAVHCFNAGEQWHLTGDVLNAAAAEQEARREAHPWEALLRAWIFDGSRSEATIEDALRDAIKLAPDRQDARSSRQVGAAFRALGWTAAPAWRQGRTVKLFVSPASAAERALSGGPGSRSMFEERDPADWDA